MNNNEKEIADTLNCFFKQFSFDDSYTQIVLEEIFREILSEKSNLHISGSERQERDQNDH